MKLYRSGSNRFCGWDDIIPERQPKLKWEKDELVLQAWRVNTEKGQGQYDYDLHLKPADLARIVGALAEQVTEADSEEVREALRPVASDLFKLMMCVSGLAKAASENGSVSALFD